MDPADAFLPSDGKRETDGEIGLAVAEPGRLWVFSMTGEVPPPLPWLSTESVDEDGATVRAGDTVHAVEEDLEVVGV